MILHFIRTGERRYAIEVEREGFPTLEMNPAPGYDRRVPHDLMHLVVEASLGLDRAVFGQLAAGGDAGTFHVKQEQGRSGRDSARKRRKQKSRGNRIKRDEAGDFDRSERATYLAWTEWLSRSTSGADQRKAVEMSSQADQIRSLMQRAEKEKFDVSLDRMCGHLDRLSKEWSGLSVGKRMSVRWPDLAVMAS
jgi:hypothetical protein